MKRARCILNLSAIAVLLIACFYILDWPSKKRYERYLSYASMDDLLKCESGNVSRVLQCGTNGLDRTIVIMDFCSLNPSGPAVLVYDRLGARIDSTRDFGNDLRFERVWRLVMRDAELARKKATNEGKDNQ